MSLYWWTDEPIKDKYALIKPIPVEIKDNSWYDNYGVYFLRLPDGGEVSDFDESVIEYIEKNLDKFSEYITKIEKYNQRYQLMLGWSHIFKREESS